MQQASTVARLLSAALMATAATASFAAEPATAPAQQSAQASDDAAIAAQASAALQQDKDLQALPLTVSSAGGGVIVVKGAAPSAELAQKAIKLAQAVPGVKEVRNEIKVG